MAAVPGDGAEGLHRHLAADGIVDHVRAVAGGQFLQHVAPVSLRIVDGGVCAVIGCELAFPFRGGCRDDARAEQFADLHGGNADAAGCAQHQQDLARAKRAALGQGIERGEVVGAEGGRCFRRDAVGYRRQRDGRHDDIFGERAGPRHAHHGLSRRKAGHACTDGIDDTCELRARREGQGILGLVEALHLQTVDEADAGGLHLDAHLPGAGVGQRDVLQRNVVDDIVLLDDDGFHADP